MAITNSIWSALVKADRKINHMLGGYKDETLSSRSYRGRVRGSWAWSVVEIIINCIMFFDFEFDSHGHIIWHCESCFHREVEDHYTLLFSLDISLPKNQKDKGD